LVSELRRGLENEYSSAVPNVVPKGLLKGLVSELRNALENEHLNELRNVVPKGLLRE
jgi:hypothetical protein